MKTWLMGFCLLFAVYTNAQYGPSGRYQTEWQYKVALAEQQQNQDRIDSLKSDVEQKQIEADSAKKYFETLRQSLLDDKKKLIPRDPWREIYGEKKYVSAGSGFVKFSGQIQEIAQNGIRVFGQWGNSENVEYFVLNFPYHFGVGESIDPTKIYAAFKDGTFHYITEDGYAKTLPKLNYGNPCTRPENGLATEIAAQQLNDEDNEQIKNANENATSKQADLDAAQKALRDFLGAIKATQDLALKTNQEQADKGDPAALRRMGERYRDGEGVEKNLAKSVEYFQKADEANAAEVNRIDEEYKLKEQAARQEKFNKNLDLANKGYISRDKGSINSIIYVGRCYRDGNGVGKDMSEAREYFQKACDLGSNEAVKLLSTCD
jgi:TPR repeat protein